MLITRVCCHGLKSLNQWKMFYNRFTLSDTHRWDILFAGPAADRCLTQGHFVTDGRSLCADRSRDLFQLWEKALSPPATRQPPFFSPRTSINCWGGELKWHLIPLTRSHYSGKTSWMRVNCSFSDPACTKNVVMSLILLTVPPHVAALISSADQCMFSRPSLQNKSTFSECMDPPIDSQMWDGVQKELSKKLRCTDRFPSVVLLAARADRGLPPIICMRRLSLQPALIDGSEKNAGFLVTLQIRSSVSTSPCFICELVFGEGKKS